MDFSSRSLPNSSRIFAKLVSAITMIMGIFVLLGWVFYLWLNESLKVFLTITMPNSALCFILAGLALWVYANPNYKRITHYIIQLGAGLVFLFSSLTLLQHFFHIELGIDKGIFADLLVNSPQTFEVGRMSPYTAVNFLLIGFCLLFLDNNMIGYRVHQILMLIVILLSLFVMLGHFYKIGNTEVFGVSIKYSQMALLNSLIFFLIAVAIIVVRPYQGIFAILASKQSGGALSRRLIPPAILLPILAGYLVGIFGQVVNIFNTDLEVSLLVITTIILFVGFILINAIFVDKVDQKRSQAEKALKRYQMQLYEILDNTSSVVYLQDLEGKYLLINKQFEKIFNKTHGQIIGKKPVEIFGLQYAKTFIESNAKVLAEHSPLSLEEMFSSQNQQDTYTYISNKFPLNDEQGNIYAIATVATDITQMKHIQEKLIDNQERLSMALESANAGIWSLDIKNDNIIWDSDTRNLFGLTTHSAPKNLNEFLCLIHPDDRQRVSQEFQSALDNTSEYGTVFRIIFSDKTTHYISSCGRIYRDTMGNAIRMTGVCSEVTQFKVIEEELRKSKEEAEFLAERAEESSRTKSAFLAAMSHEIRTPLNGVIGMSDFLINTPLTKDQSKYVDNIRISGEVLLSIINDILDFTRIESGYIGLDNMDFDLITLVDEAVELISAQTYKKDIEINALIEPDVPTWLIGDFSKIRHVLNNLLNNAHKFSNNRGEITIIVKLLHRETNKIELLFEINDTGIGIEKNVIPKLFEPFTQGDASLARKHGGTGLGLAISKRLIEIMGGKIGVESKVGAGSRFWFSLKLLGCNNPKPEIQYEIIPELVGRRILCVDDSLLHTEIFKKLFDSLEMRYEMVTSPANVLYTLKKAAMENDCFSLALINYKLKGINGLELVEIIREIPDIATTPVILLSSLGMDINTDFILSSNIYLLTKPLKPKKLYDCIMTIARDLYASTEIISHGSKNHSDQIEYVARILLAEDNLINQQVTTKILENLGYKVDIAFNGHEVLDILNKFQYDLILMDCQMPEMDGYTATIEIRKQELISNKHIPIVALTAHALQGDQEKCLAAGMDDYIPKPFKIDVLSDTLERFLKKNSYVGDSIEMKTTPSKIPESVFTTIDMKRLYDIFGDDSVSICEFIKSLLISMKDLLQQIEEAVKAKNATIAKKAFHTLKGSSGNSGATQMHELCKIAEEAVLNENWPLVEKQCGELQTLFQKMQNEFDQSIHISQKNTVI